jgi:hypothetical protein
VTEIKELSTIAPASHDTTIASASHDNSPHIVKFSHIQVSPHSSIMLQKFNGGSGVGGFAVTDMML